MLLLTVLGVVVVVVVVVMLLLSVSSCGVCVLLKAGPYPRGACNRGTECVVLCCVVSLKAPCRIAGLTD